MTEKEKARAYDEALEKAKQIIVEHGYDEHSNVFMEIFPELEESEDERVKSCISMILTDANETRFNDFHTTLADCFAWLEKQGNQREQLINKACDVLVNCIEDYMLRRMEVWNEESKKQTLENIRKKLEE